MGWPRSCWGWGSVPQTGGRAPLVSSKALNQATSQSKEQHRQSSELPYARSVGQKPVGRTAHAAGTDGFQK